MSEKTVGGAVVVGAVPTSKSERDLQGTRIKRQLFGLFSPGATSNCPVLRQSVPLHLATHETWQVNHLRALNAGGLHQPHHIRMVAHSRC